MKTTSPGVSGLAALLLVFLIGVMMGGAPTEADARNTQSYRALTQCRWERTPESAPSPQAGRSLGHCASVVVGLLAVGMESSSPTASGQGKAWGR